MSVERVIGIDFGTSTSVVKIKTYRDDQPVEAREIAESLLFDNKDTLPTLVYVTTDGRFLVGYEAENAAVRGTLHQNFKLDLINPNRSIREEAFHYTEIFLKYLCEAYNDQKTYLQACDVETTYISYPAKWPDELRDIMINLVQKVGFKNVHGLDEPTAAIHTVMIQQNDTLVLDEKQSANILMIDMGAGTTDLVLCRYTPQNIQPVSILNVWPKADSSSLFGGREIDEVLCAYVESYLLKCGLPKNNSFKDKYLDKCKAWKESNISPVFRDKSGVVRYCGFIDTLTAMLNVDVEFPPLSRDMFEDMFKDYLSRFVEMINDCLDDAGFNHADLDYVILTGGHSQWYFTHEILDGSLLKFGSADLPKIHKDKNRVIKLSRPQETVSLGLVYQKMASMPSQRPSASGGEGFCGHCGSKIPLDAAYCSHCGKGEMPYSEAEAPGADQNTENSHTAKTEIYVLQYGKTMHGMAATINNFLSLSKGMDTQVVNLDDGDLMIQARDKGGKWKQWFGLDKAITVKIERMDEDRVSVHIGESKWVDKVGIMALSMIILWPLSITSGIGMFMQAKLPNQIKNEIARYLIS